MAQSGQSARQGRPKMQFASDGLCKKQRIRRRRIAVCWIPCFSLQQCMAWYIAPLLAAATPPSATSLLVASIRAVVQPRQRKIRCRASDAEKRRPCWGLRKRPSSTTPRPSQPTAFLSWSCGHGLAMHAAGVHADETNRHCAFCLSGIVSLTFARFVGNLAARRRPGGGCPVTRWRRRRRTIEKKCTMLGSNLFIDIATSLVLVESPTNPRFL